MIKRLINTYKGTIVNKFLPDILENGQYLEEENIDIIGLEIQLPNKKIKIIKDRDSKYSDLFGTYNGKTQYHVDFTIEGNDGIYPIFASKHPNSDSINFTYNEAINPDLADELANPSTDE